MLQVPDTPNCERGELSSVGDVAAKGCGMLQMVFCLCFFPFISIQTAHHNLVQ